MYILYSQLHNRNMHFGDSVLHSSALAAPKDEKTIKHRSLTNISNAFKLFLFSKQEKWDYCYEPFNCAVINDEDNDWREGG